MLKLQGKIIGQWVDELRRVSEEILGRVDARVVLDMADVTFIDTAGTALLQELTTRNVELTNCSPFATEQLKIHRVETDTRHT